MGYIWKAITSTIQQPLIQALVAEDEGQVESLLSNSIQRNGQHGIEDIVNWQHYANGNPYVRQCIESGLIMTLPDFLGFNNRMGAPMGFVSHSVVSLLIRQHNAGNYPKSMLEIGPGLGFMAVAMFRAGVRDYTIIDLPSNAVVAAHVIMKCVGEENVWLYGEPEADRAIKFLPSTNYLAAAVRTYDVIYNKNSFPEIGTEEQDKYIALFASCLAPSGFLFSANHENRPPSQRPLPVAMKGQTELRLTHREPFPDFLAENTMLQDEPGYFLEIYRRGTPA